MNRTVTGQRHRELVTSNDQQQSVMQLFMVLLISDFKGYTVQLG